MCPGKLSEERAVEPIHCEVVDSVQVKCCFV